MTQITATLVAAVVAATAAVASLVVTTVAAYRREGREAEREALQPHLGRLGEAIHQTVATSFMQQKALANDSRVQASNWRKRGSQAAGDLGRIRLEMRYPLSGLDEGFRNLERLPAWVAHRRGGSEGAEILARADALAQELHRAIEESWRRGRPPTSRRRRRIARKAAALRAVAPIGAAPREVNAS